MIKPHFILVLSFIFNSTSFAKSLELSKDGRTIFVKEKKSWKLGKDLFGMPFVLFSARDKGQRSNISFTDTGADIKLEFEALKENQETFQKNKSEWAKTVGAEIKGYTPYESILNAYGHRVHKIGFAYEFNKKKYDETSYFIECRGRIIFSKSLRLQESMVHEKEFKDLIHNLDCGGV